MEINKTNAMKLWNERYGKQTQKTSDFSGRIMTKGQYGHTNSKTGWTIDHRQPLSKGGSNAKCNLEIVNHETNAEKANDITFTANGKQFQVQKDSGNGCYKIVELKSNKSTTKIKNTQTKGKKRLVAEKLFKETIENNLDMAGRTINFNSFETSNNDAWGIGFYTSNKKISVDNCFVAHVKTLADQKGKSSFKSNGILFELKKINGKYHYINTTNITNRDDFINAFGYINNLYKQEQNIYKDLITLKISYRNDEHFSKFIILLEEILPLISLKSNYIIPRTYSDWGLQERKIHVIFDTPEENDTCIAHEFAMYINTLKSYLIKITSITDITIYHSTHTLNTNEYLEFLHNIDSHFESKVRSYHTNTLFVSNEVKNYLTKCHYKEDTFTEHAVFYNDSYYERNYGWFKQIKELLDNFN